jgi:anaerobic C4-dicarboxylate transporter DcuA
VLKRGKELSVDPEFIERMKDPVFAKNLDDSKDTVLALKDGATRSVAIFALAVLGVVLLGSFPSLLPTFSEKEGFIPTFAVNASGQVQIPSMIMMIMLAAAGFIILFCKTTASQVTKASLFASAGQATIAVFGVVWMSSTFMNHNAELIEATLGSLVKTYPWSFAIALFHTEYFTFQPGCHYKSIDATGIIPGIGSSLPCWNFSSCEWSLFCSGLSNFINCHSVRPYRHNTYRKICA